MSVYPLCDSLEHTFYPQSNLLEGYYFLAFFPYSFRSLTHCWTKLNCLCCNCNWMGEREILSKMKIFWTLKWTAFNFIQLSQLILSGTVAWTQLFIASLFSHRKLEVMQQTVGEANTKFWGTGQSFVTLTLRFDMHDIRAFGRENWPFVLLHGTKNNTLLDGKRRRG